LLWTTKADSIQSIFTIHNCTFDDIVSTGTGGVFYYDSDALMDDTSISITNSNFTSCTAESNAVLSIQSAESTSTNILIKSCRFQDIKAAAIGGVVSFSIDIATFLTLAIQQSYFSNCDASEGTIVALGSVEATSISTTVSDCTFSNISARTRAAIFQLIANTVTDASLAINSCTFTDVTAGSAAILHFASATSISSSSIRFTDNTYQNLNTRDGKGSFVASAGHALKNQTLFVQRDAIHDISAPTPSADNCVYFMTAFRTNSSSGNVTFDHVTYANAKAIPALFRSAASPNTSEISIFCGTHITMPLALSPVVNAPDINESSFSCDPGYQFANGTFACIGKQFF
jgi:hypothetical protein